MQKNSFALNGRSRKRLKGAGCLRLSLSSREQTEGAHVRSHSVEISERARGSRLSRLASSTLLALAAMLMPMQSAPKNALAAPREVSAFSSGASASIMRLFRGPAASKSSSVGSLPEKEYTKKALPPNVFVERGQIDADPRLQKLVKEYRAEKMAEWLAKKHAAREGERNNPAYTIGSRKVIFRNKRYSEFLDDVRCKRLFKVTLSSDLQRLLAYTYDGDHYKLSALPNDPDLLRLLHKHKVDVKIVPMQESASSANGKKHGAAPNVKHERLGASQSSVGTRRSGVRASRSGSSAAPMKAFRFLAVALLITVLLRIAKLSGIGAGGINPLEFGKSSARVALEPATNVTFRDVAGVGSAIVELQEVVEFLRDAGRFTALGARIPRGVLLDGPPGTGKTLLARAVAGEAGVPFVSVSGSEFVEMFVGVGASRVRDLFRQAKKHAPCIAFIDEIDAVGRSRGSGGRMSGGNEEREQTLNQLLTEMDGFDGSSGVIVLAATNRAEVLDRALTRPGRFDRRISVGLPDYAGRSAILSVHAQNKPLGKDVSLELVARRTPGFSGAALQNLLNEAAIFAARKSKKVIDGEDVDAALERVTIGLARSSAAMSAQRARLVAIHEAGHAVMGALTPLYDTVQSISIVPRGGAGGLTFFAPDELRVDTGLYSRQYLTAQLAVALGGRVAEELEFGPAEVTTGASNDFEQVTRVARQMVMRFGFSDEFRAVSIDPPSSNGMPGANPVSSETMRRVDAQVSLLVDAAHQHARELLSSNRALLEALAAKLVEQETVSSQEFEALIVTHDIHGYAY